MLCEKGSGSSSSSIVVVNFIFDRFAASTQVGFHSYRFDSFLSAYKINECMISDLCSQGSYLFWKSVKNKVTLKF